MPSPCPRCGAKHFAHQRGCEFCHLYECGTQAICPDHTLNGATVQTPECRDNQEAATDGN